MTRHPPKKKMAKNTSAKRYSNGKIQTNRFLSSIGFEVLNLPPKLRFAGKGCWTLKSNRKATSPWWFRGFSGVYITPSYLDLLVPWLENIKIYVPIPNGVFMVMNPMVEFVKNNTVNKQK